MAKVRYEVRLIGSHGCETECVCFFSFRSLSIGRIRKTEIQAVKTSELFIPILAPDFISGFSTGISILGDYMRA